MQKIIVLVLAYFFSQLSLIAQDAIIRCGTTEYMAGKSYGNTKVLENENQNQISGVIVIPVVVHVLYKGEPLGVGTNIPSAQIESQIDILNEDFRANNNDLSAVPNVFKPAIGDSKIQFCLASINPDSNPSSGIVRKLTTNSFFTLDDKIKFDTAGGSNAWPADRYLNIWVGDLKDFGGGSSLLGYATFPGGPPENDGIVILSSAFGNKGTVSPPYNRGRTVTHEVGHWLGLYHIWGDSQCGDDFCADTPPQEGPNYGINSGQGFQCPQFPKISALCGNAPEGDMYMNYMDYTYDKCLNMFTKIQCKRMNNALENFRSSFFTNSICAPAPAEVDTAEVDFEIYPSLFLPGDATNELNVLIVGELSTDIEVNIYNALGQLFFNEIYLKDEYATQTKFIIDTSLMPGGGYFIRISANKKDYVKRFVKSKQ
ncbi:MAG: T9SS type A sorting domain-containing protein [Bacteroidetes bacterium]|nr:T9SS type A sorting domain-containing protein [Bacteroidota bacterium]